MKYGSFSSDSLTVEIILCVKALDINKGRLIIIKSKSSMWPFWKKSKTIHIAFSFHLKCEHVGQHYCIPLPLGLCLIQMIC